MSSFNLFSTWRYSWRTTIQCKSCATLYPARSYAALARAIREDGLAAESKAKTSSLATDVSLRRSPRKLKNQHPKSDNESFASPLEPNTVDLYLASIKNTGLEPTIADVERYKPEKHATPGSSQYAEQYNSLLDTLCQSFTKSQLRGLTQLYELGTTSKLKKIQYAEAIVERQWKWPSLRDIQKQKRDRTEVSTKSFPANPSQLFLLLGKDGIDLLQMSKQYNVQITLESNPFALRAEGTRASLRSLSDVISKLKKSIIEDTFDLPTKKAISKDLLQHVSRLSGAHVENFGTDGKIRICAKDQASLTNAKRLATRAACEAQITPSSRTMSFLPDELDSETPVATQVLPRLYSLFPFLSTQSIPWTRMGAAFRVRRVKEWLGVNKPKKLETLRTSGTANLKTIADLKGQPIDLKSFLFTDASVGPGFERVVQASTGHAMLATPTTPHQTSLIAPFKGYWSFEKIASWMRNTSFKIGFSLGSPPPTVELPTLSRRVLQRLLYRAIPKEDGNTNSNSAKVIKLEIDLTNIKAEPAEKSSVDLGLEDGRIVSQSESFLTQTAQVKFHCWTGSEILANLLMPDRPMDLRFSLCNFSAFEEGQEPSAIHEYVESLRNFLKIKDLDSSQPVPPLTFTHDGSVYVLNTNSSIKQSKKLVPAHSAEPTVSVVAEDALDLESGEKSACYHITHTGDISEQAWAGFLSSCDHLTTIPYSTSS